MKTIRRYYFYIVSLVSLEAVVWATIYLIRSMFSSDRIGGNTNQLATALSYLIVAIPVFLIHWNWVRKDVVRNEEQRPGGIRVFFLYLASLILWVPVVQNLIAIILRILSSLMNTPQHGLVFGASQCWGDNIAGLLVNLVFAIFVQKVIQEDREKADYSLAGEYIRKIWWYLIALYPLVLTFFGLERIIYYVVMSNQQIVRSSNGLVNGLGLIIVGLPLWVWLWSELNKRIKKDEEPVLVRQIFLTLKYLVFLIILFTTTTTIISQISRGLLIPSETGDYYAAIAYFIPALIFWVYFNRIIKKEADDWKLLLKQIYLRFMTLISLVVSFIGLAVAGWHLIELSYAAPEKSVEFLKSDIIEGFAMFLVWGMVWWVYWQPRKEKDEQGLSAGQKLIERIYLYLVVGATVIGGMVSAAGFLYVIIQALLEGAGSDFISDLLTSLYVLILFVAVLVYHLRYLRQFAKKEEEVVKEKALVEILSFGPLGSLIAQSAEQDQKLDVIVHDVKEGLPDEKTNISMIFIGSEKLASLTKAEEKYISSFKGRVIVVPEQKDNWYYMSSNDAVRPNLDVNMLKLISDAAAGEELKISPRRSVWEVFGYLFAVMVGVGFLCIIAQILLEAANGF
jgi:hypothetical protein